MAEKDKTLTVFMAAFIAVLLAVALIGTIADTSNTSTKKLTVSDESYNLSSLGCYQAGQVNGTTDVNCNLTVTNAPTGWEQEDCPLTSVVVTNNTGTALTLDTDYLVFASTGIIQMLNTTSTNSTNLGNVAKVDYAYCGDGYLNSSWGRTILDTNVGMFALTILIIAIAAAYVLLGKKGDDD
jgi:hypothetical protein